MNHKNFSDGGVRPNAFTKRFAKVIADRPRKVLDVGCWEGRDSLFLAQQGHNVVGITNQPEEQEIAKARAKALGLTACRFITMDARNLDTLRSEQFDAILVCNMLHEVPRTDMVTIIGTMQHMTKPGGYNAISAYLASDETRSAASRDRMFHRGELIGLYTNGGDWDPQEYHEDDYRASVSPGGKEFVASHATLIARRMPPQSERAGWQDMMGN